MRIYGVAELTRYIKLTLDSDSLLQDLWVQGEVSNCITSVAGHTYFTAKDAESQLRCVLFRSVLPWGAPLPQNGQAAVLHGRLSIYETQGVYQLYVDSVHPQGVGLLQLQFEQLKAKLAREGLFAEERKRALPRFPERIGVVTSLQAAALQDIINIIKRRYPLVELILSPTLVQGDEAAERICRAIEALNQRASVDVIIVARGGGSLEELWPFNEEMVARAIYASKSPIVTGIGHETDFTIADGVADLRAPTPSAAAEMVVPDQRECRLQIAAWQRQLFGAIETELQNRRDLLTQRAQTLQWASPKRLIERHRQVVDDLAREAARRLQHYLEVLRHRLEGRMLQLQSLSPQEVLERGYGIIWHLGTQRVVGSVVQVAPGDALRLQVADGSFYGRAESARGRQARLGGQAGDGGRGEKRPPARLPSGARQPGLPGMEVETDEGR